ncbi:hypothetical protein ACORGP_001802 [Campylobacter coli]
MGRQIEIDPRVAMNGGYKDAKDDLFLWYFEVMENEEIKIYPKKLTYNQMLEECKKNDIYIIKPLYSLGYTYNNNKCGEKIYVEFQPNEKFIFKCPNCSRKNRKVFYAF